MATMMTRTLPLLPIGGGGERTTTLPSPRIEAQLIDTTIRLNKLAVITRRKCSRRGDELATTDDKYDDNKSTIN